MKVKMYITTEQEDRFCEEHPDYKGRSVECACGESWGYENSSDPNAPIVVVCDACYNDATSFERFY